jgi:hypothetical protein
MKAILLLTFSTLFFSFGSSQEIPNGTLESWENMGGWFENPTDWQTMNNQVQVSTTKESNACEGEFAMKVSPLAAIETVMGSAFIEFPIQSIPSSLSFCVKTNVLEEEFFTDTCRVIVSFWNGETSFYTEEWINTSSLEEWTEISLPLNQIEPIMDGCKIEVQASFPGTGLGSGSLDTWIVIDDLTFEDINSVEHYIKNDFSVYPNPNSDGEFSISSSVPISEVKIFNLLGEEVFNQNAEWSKSVQLSTKLNTGVYLLLIDKSARKLIIE